MPIQQAKESSRQLLVDDRTSETHRTASARAILGGEGVSEVMDLGIYLPSQTGGTWSRSIFVSEVF